MTPLFCKSSYGYEFAGISLFILPGTKPIKSLRSGQGGIWNLGQYAAGPKITTMVAIDDSLSQMQRNRVRLLWTAYNIVHQLLVGIIRPNFVLVERYVDPQMWILYIIGVYFFHKLTMWLIDSPHTLWAAANIWEIWNKPMIQAHYVRNMNNIAY